MKASAAPLLLCLLLALCSCLLAEQSTDAAYRRSLAGNDVATFTGSVASQLHSDGMSFVGKPGITGTLTVNLQPIDRSAGTWSLSYVITGVNTISPPSSQLLLQGSAANRLFRLSNAGRCYLSDSLDPGWACNKTVTLSGTPAGDSPLDNLYTSSSYGSTSFYWVLVNANNNSVGIVQLKKTSLPNGQVAFPAPSNFSSFSKPLLGIVSKNNYGKMKVLIKQMPNLGSQLLSASITVNLPTALTTGKPSAQLRRGSPSGALVLDLNCSWQASDSRTTWQCDRVTPLKLSARDNSNLASLFLSIFYVLPEPFAYNTLG